MRKLQYVSTGLLAALVGSLSTGEAAAHNFSAHDAIVRAATSAMHYWVEGKGTTEFCPAPGELPTDPDFATYKSQVTNALTNLRKLRTGLNSVAFDTSSCNQITNSDGSVSGYYPEDNLDKLGQFRIKDFRYLVERDYTTGCKMDALHNYTASDSTPVNRLTDEKWRTLGSVLGTAAGDVDNRNRDTVLWVKPLNAWTWGAIKDGLSLGVTIAGAVLLAPFACVWSLFSDGSCGDSKKWAIKYNPVDFAAGLVPGIPWDFTGEDIGLDINGVWHFEQTNSGGNAVTFANDPSGMWYPVAGPDLKPGALDVVIMAATSAAGVSLDARESLGVRDFGQFDEADRYWTSWEAHAFSNTEFTPVSKLAKYGKKEYDASGRTVAAKLGYPLHAFADATFPHHLANTTAWGHRPMEDAINNKRKEALKFTTEGDHFDDCHRPVDMILEGYYWWKRYNLGQPGSHVDIEDAIEALAKDSRIMIDSASGVWSDSASDQYLLGGKDASTKSYENETYDPFGLTLAEFAAPLGVFSVGASIALLTDIGKDVADVPLDPTTKCPSGTTFAHGVGCETTTVKPTLPPAGGAKPAGKHWDGQIGSPCNADSQCKGSNVECGSNHQCCVSEWPELPAASTSCSKNSDCCPGLSCSLGHCVVIPNIGDSCTSNAQCKGADVVCGAADKCCIVSWWKEQATQCHSNSDCCPDPYTGSMEDIVCHANQCDQSDILF